MILRPKRHSLITLFAVICLTMTACDKKKKTTKTKTDATTTQDLPGQEPTAWSTVEAAQSIDVMLTGNGPAFKFQDFTQTIDLAPIDSGPQKWTHKTQKDVKILSGATSWKNHHVDINWHLSPGDPQADVYMTLNRVGVAHLGEPIEASVILPKGNISYINNQLQRDETLDKTVTIHNWTHGWIKWTNDTHALTLSDWSFDQVTLEPQTDGQIKLTFTLWNPTQHPPITACDVKGRETLTIQHRIGVAFGARQDLILGRLPAGFESAIVPLFSDPSKHPDKTLKRAGALDTKDWIKRTRTILHGHSSSGDPRFGNGGLLGTNLGGSILAPKDTPVNTIDGLHKELKQTRAQIALDRPPAPSDGAGAFVAKNFPCKAVLGRRQHANEQVLVELGNPHDGSYLNALKPRIAMVIGDKQITTVPPAFNSNLPAHVVLPRLSGQRSMLADQLLSSLYIKRLKQERGIAWFSTPLVATRNPLDDAASDQLIDPERHGHWTLNPLLAKTFGALELAQEDRSTTMLGISSMVNYHRALSHIHIKELPDGSFAIQNNNKTELKNITFIVRSAATVVVDKTPLKTTKTVTLPSGDTQTWFWLTLKPGTTNLSFQEGQSQNALKPTAWKIKN